MGIAIGARIELDTELVEGLSPETCLERARAAERVAEVGYLVSGFYWWEIKRRAAWVELGYRDFATMIHDQSGEALRTVEERVSTAREAVQLPRSREAFNAGAIKWSHLRSIARVATPETERAWLDEAIELRTKAFASLTAHKEKGDLPTDPERTQTRTPLSHRGGDLNPAELELFELVRAMVSEVVGHEATDREVLVFATSVLARLRPDGSIPGWKKIADKPYVLHVKEGSAGQPYLDGHEGAPVPLDATTLESMARFPFHSQEVAEALRPVDLQKIELAVLDPKNSGPLVPEELRAEPTSKALRDETLLRDGFRCRGCGSRRRLAAHHRHWRSFGGATDLANLLTVCDRCHSLIHVRFLIVVGEPNGELRFLDRHGRPTKRCTSSPVEIPLVREERKVCETVAAAVDAEPSAGPRAPEATAPATVAPAVRLDDVIGQDEVRDRIGFAIEAAKKQDGMPPHTLLCGLPGVGKSFTAEAMAGELVAPFVALSGPRIQTSAELVQALTTMRPRSVVFMDELHALPRHVVEGVLYEALDKGTVTITVRDGGEVRSRTLRLAPFTFVGATTDEDLLPAPLLSRLRREQLGLYSVPALARLLTRAAGKQGLALEPEAAALLAGASRETPRQGLSLLRDVRDEAAVAGVERVDAAIVERALQRRGVDRDGFDAVDRTVLRALEEAGGRPLSLRTLATRSGISEGRLASVHEPFLIRRGLLEVTPLGRVLRRARAAA